MAEKVTRPAFAVRRRPRPNRMTVEPVNEDEAVN